MILRAFFWIAVVAILMPREPDLGFGRPGGIALPSALMSWLQPGAGLASTGLVSTGFASINPAASSLQSSRTVRDCKNREDDCGGEIRTLDQLQELALSGLAEVKAEIEADKRARKGHSG